MLFLVLSHARLSANELQSYLLSSSPFKLHIRNFNLRNRVFLVCDVFGAFFCGRD